MIWRWTPAHEQTLPAYFAEGLRPTHSPLYWRPSGPLGILETAHEHRII